MEAIALLPVFSALFTRTNSTRNKSSATCCNSALVNYLSLKYGCETEASSRVFFLFLPQKSPRDHMSRNRWCSHASKDASHTNQPRFRVAFCPELLRQAASLTAILQGIQFQHPLISLASGIPSHYLFSHELRRPV